MPRQRPLAAASRTAGRLPRRGAVGAFVGGLLVGNSAPHLASAVTGRVHLTPLKGRDSGPLVNLAWGAANLLGGLAVTRACLGRGRRWDRSLVAFDAGVATFAAWIFVSEYAMPLNSAPGGSPTAGGPR
ncbi:hypothetical protein LEP48_03475 [Isoptericola sp. NEAU-Y5]|uniref:Uncharacterized protein n=1 Tax=Isoptericola luteus TaxID=2879484 RepID=A0ABS7ZBI6_9MICO|nr:hypothetical protein [Isoptericola sp. NEAU-Y5]MCA5892413.1 hypothetical protein [Isoptericola sp. NEAU-Y5]